VKKTLGWTLSIAGMLGLMLTALFCLAAIVSIVEGNLPDQAQAVIIILGLGAISVVSMFGGMRLVDPTAKL